MEGDSLLGGKLKRLTKRVRGTKVYNTSFVKRKAASQPGRAQKGLPTRTVSSARRGAFRSSSYLNQWDIKQHAIQIFHTDLAERHHELQKNPWYMFTLHPNDRFRRTFDIFTVVWVILLVFMIPFEIGFPWYQFPKWTDSAFIFLDIWFAVDIILNFKTGYLQHGTIVMRSEKIIKHYLTTWFFIDLMGSFPFERFITPEAKSRKSLKLVKYFKIPKLMRISRLLKYVHDHKHVYDIFEVLVCVITILHFGSCIWIRVIDPCPDDMADNLAATHDLCQQDRVYSLYVEALHTSAVMILGISNFHVVAKSENLDMLYRKLIEDSNKVRMDIYIVSTVFMIVGLFIVSLLISKMNVYVMGKMQGSAAFQQRSDRVKYEMEYYRVPPDLQVQVKAFYDYVWIHQRQYDDKIALLSDKQMSSDLQRKLALHMYKDVVTHISFFSELDDLLLGSICMSLRSRIFLPNDMILFKGDIGKELFIVAKGVVEVLRDDLKFNERSRRSQPILLRKGAFFGEIALIMDVRRTCSVRSATICEVNILQQAVFDAILRANPEFARKINELVAARQLEHCIDRFKGPGTSFKFSKRDLDIAVESVEATMKKGLNKRKSSNSIKEEEIASTHGRSSTVIEKINGQEHFAANNRESIVKNVNELQGVFDDITQRSKFVANNDGSSSDEFEDDGNPAVNCKESDIDPDFDGGLINMESVLPSIREAPRANQSLREREGRIQEIMKASLLTGEQRKMGESSSSNEDNCFV